MLATIGPVHREPRPRRGGRSASSTRRPTASRKVFFTNGGADANENAIRMARLHTGRDKVLSTYRSYHGNTGAAIVATGDWRRMPNEYARGHVHFFGPYLYRSEFWATTPEEESARALRHLERVIQSEGPATIAAILLEIDARHRRHPLPPPGYLAGVRALCDRYGIMLILDEVMAGFGRTGRWFAFEGYDVVPDLITFAKGVNSGYVPVGGVIISDAIAATFDDRVFPGGLTYSGHPLAMASIVASIDAMESEGIVENARRDRRATAIGPGLAAARRAASAHRRGARRRRLLGDRARRRPRDPRAGARGRHRRSSRTSSLDARPAAVRADNRIHVVPPCVVTDDEVAAGDGDLRRGV